MKNISAFLITCGVLAAQAPQAPNPTSNAAENAARMASGSVPIYRVTVVARTMKAINYNHRSGSTHIGFQGTTLMPKATGEAKVESKQGVIKIDAEMQKLEPAGKFGPEYLTYVIWAVTPEGRATNVGEVLLHDGKSKLNATTELQSFGLFVTAEPYFAVTQPSDVVVMENFVRKDTTGTIEQLDAKFELLQRGQYTLNVNPSEIRPFKLDPKVPLELYEARNALQIARWTGAERYSADTYQKAVIGVLNAEGYLKGKAGSRPIGTVAREAVQMAEDSRIITLKKMAAEQLENERQAGYAREAKAESASAAAQAETGRVTQSAAMAQAAAQTEAQRIAREHDLQMNASQIEANRLRNVNAASQMEADRLKKSNEESGALLAAAQSETNRLKMSNDTLSAAAQAEAARLKLANESEIAAAKSETDRLKVSNDTQSAAAQAEAARLKLMNESEIAAAKAETDSLKRDLSAQAAASKMEADRLKVSNDAQTAAVLAETARGKMESEAQMAAAKTEASRLKQENDAQRATSQAGLDRAAADKAQAEAEKTALRAQLLIQFNAILETRDTARGLIVNMADVLFDTAKFSLRPLAREKLAKVAGIMAGHSGLRLQVEGFTDSVGGDEYNQTLSENRATSVRDYLTKAGLSMDSVTSKGFGKTMPVASNETAVGRQQNRRVELVVSGEMIGANINQAPFLAGK